jgi:hypothetical protein
MSRSTFRSAARGGCSSRGPAQHRGSPTRQCRLHSTPSRRRPVPRCRHSRLCPRCRRLGLHPRRRRLRLRPQWRHPQHLCFRSRRLPKGSMQSPLRPQRLAARRRSCLLGSPRCRGSASYCCHRPCSLRKRAQPRKTTKTVGPLQSSWSSSQENLSRRPAGTTHCFGSSCADRQSCSDGLLHRRHGPELRKSKNQDHEPRTLQCAALRKMQ